MKDFCPLCSGLGEMFYNKPKRKYYKCTNCNSLFVPFSLLPDPQKEKTRYLNHNNDVNDPRYQNFVMPVVNAIENDFTTTAYGLDYGAGTGPVISKLLHDKGYKIMQYDPLFFPDWNLLEKTYDYIVCCEVAEHFFKPKQEFSRLKKLLNPGGKLYCKTSIYEDKIDFNNWRYKNDPTHVFIYSKKTMEWIKEKFGFSEMNIQEGLIIFSL